jgi:hypothetical protein
VKRYLQTILLFDVVLPVIFLGLPCGLLLWAVLTFQNFVLEKKEAHTAYETQSRQVATLNAELAPMQAKTALLKGLLSSTDIEAKLVSGVGAGLDKLFSRWEPLNRATADWETRFPNLVLESLAIDLVPGTPVSTPYLQSTLTYFVVTEN